MNAPKDFRTMTADSIGKDILSALVTELKLLPDSWPKIPKIKQDDIIDRLRERVADNVKMAVHLLAAEGRTVVAGDLDQITIKDGVKAVIKFGSNAANLHELYDVAGKAVLLVVAHSAQHTGGMDEIHGEADQRGLDLGHEYKPNSDGEGMGGTVINGEASRLPSPEDVTVTEEQLDAAYDDGYVAANDGKLQSDCPIMAGKLCIEWVKGWKHWHEENDQVKTAKLGALPNEHGVYTCEPDELIEWGVKEDRVSIKLLELVNGMWLHTVNIYINGEGTSSPLTRRFDSTESRDDALRIVQGHLVKIYAKGEASGLKGKALKDFTDFVNNLIETDERKAA
jgi:ribosome modulation factor